MSHGCIVDSIKAVTCRWRCVTENNRTCTAPWSHVTKSAPLVCDQTERSQLLLVTKRIQWIRRFLRRHSKYCYETAPMPSLHGDAVRAPAPLFCFSYSYSSWLRFCHTHTKISSHSYSRWVISIGARLCRARSDPSKPSLSRLLFFLYHLYITQFCLLVPSFDELLY